jgi:teichoic acid transport system permease protein
VRGRSLRTGTILARSRKQEEIHATESCQPLSTLAEHDRQPYDDYTAERHVYVPHRIGLPPLRSYVREIWRRRQFAVELARTDVQSRYFNTVFGQLWLILNPLLLALALFLLVEIIRGGDRGAVFLAHLMATLFAFRLVTMAVRQGSRSVVGGGRLILNTAFPRMLLPLSAVLTACIRFVPMIALYAIVHLAVGLPIGLNLLWALPVLGIIALFAFGAALLVATVQVYFRDLKYFLRYFLRIWLYVSPILWYVDEVPESLEALVALNPMYPMLGALSDVVNQGLQPNGVWLAWGFAWAALTFVAGALFFVSREREFAVRL